MSFIYSSKLTEETRGASVHMLHVRYSFVKTKDHRQTYAYSTAH